MGDGFGGGYSVSVLVLIFLAVSTVTGLNFFDFVKEVVEWEVSASYL